jgi:RNA polymerase sigma-70 factor (ECF subfamily)
MPESAAMDLDTLRALQRLARRHSRRPGDADDLLQETLLAGLQAGRADLPWLSGVLRRQAALAARSTLRRRRREAATAEAQGCMDEPAGAAPAIDPRPLLERLPPSARRLAVLALHGLDADEIRWILGVTPTAFRQRLSRIRQGLGELPPALRAEALGLAYVRDPARAVALQFGLLRRALKAALNGDAGLGSHDPDGHLIVVRRRAHTSASSGND